MRAPSNRSWACCSLLTFLSLAGATGHDLEQKGGGMEIKETAQPQEETGKMHRGSIEIVLSGKT